MKPDNWNRFAAGLLAILLCLCSFSMPAFARDRKSTRLNSSHWNKSRMPSSA